MGLNSVVSAERVHISFFGARNAGKSSLVNAVTGQQLSVVSEVKGTTTDPVKKAMELLPLGPVVIIDTPGFDDCGALGELRVKKTKEILRETDIAVLAVDASKGISNTDNELVSLFKKKNIPFIIAFSKADLYFGEKAENSLYVSAKTGYNINALKEKLAEFNKMPKDERHIVSDLISKDDTVLLVIPVDESAPKGRLILPQQQTIRDILDAHASVICCQDTELTVTLNHLKEPPKMVITDSQAFKSVAANTPENITLTSFSILFARYKGNLKALVEGASALDKLNDGDTVLISEGCTHHRQCNDIGTVKMPNWVNGYTGKKLNYEFTSGGEFPEDLSKYKLIIHCGGCMLNEREVKSRIAEAENQNVKIVNYGVAIAHIHGILKRSLKPFPEISKLL